MAFVRREGWTDAQWQWMRRVSESQRQKGPAAPPVITDEEKEAYILRKTVEKVIEQKRLKEELKELWE